MRRSIWLWSLPAALYLGFRVWYDGGGGPLTPEEVRHYVAILEERGTPPARLENLREFLASDTGRDFVMANFIQLQDQPDAQAELDRYMAHMYPAMFARAGHPVFAGPVVAAIDLWGIEDAERWSLVGLVPLPQPPRHDRDRDGSGLPRRLPVQESLAGEDHRHPRGALSPAR